MSTDIAALSYGMATLAFFAFNILIISEWRGKLYGAALSIACMISVLYFAAVTYQLASGKRFPVSSDLLEFIRDAAWTAFLLILVGPFQKSSKSSAARLKSSVVYIAAYYVFILLLILYENLNQPLILGEIIVMNSFVVRMSLAIIGFLLVEQYYRSTPVKERWGIKYFCLGILGMFAYDFYLYSDAMMFSRIDTDIWTARGVVNALIVPMLAISVARHPTWSHGISVSRSMLFHSTTLFGSAIYLLTMSAAGYYLRIFGGSWGGILQLVFLFLAISLLAGFMFSGTIRSWLKVFISKHFYNYNYDYREEWQRFTDAFSENEHRFGEPSIRAMAALVESPGGMLFLNNNLQHFMLAASWNMHASQISEPSETEFCKYLERIKWVIDLHEYADNPKKYKGIMIPQWLENVENAWLVVPLILHGNLFGFMVLALPRSKIKLNWEVIDLLKIAGSQAANYLALEKSANELMVARQFESFNRMSTFVVHDLRNLISQLSLLLSNSDRHKKNPEFQKDMLDTLTLSVRKMKLLLNKLGTNDSAETSSPLSISSLLQQTVELKSSFWPKPDLEIKDAGLMILANWDRLERVLGHLVQNAIEATPRNGQVIVSIVRKDESALIEIIDTGHGMSEAFIRETLYQPFESTKPAGMGIGVFESRDYIHKIGGQLEVRSSPGVGTTFQVILPLCKHESYSEAVV